VTALRPSTTSDRPFTPVSAQLHVLTDANGEYRLEGLSSDDYFVVVLPQNGSGSPLQRAKDGYGRTFFPNASDVKAAGRVRVRNTETTHADVTLAPARLATISGIVMASDGQPARTGTVQLSHGDYLFGLDSHAYGLPASGRFLISAIAPGTYFLTFHESAWPPPRGEVPLISQTKVVVAGDDVPDIRVIPIHMVQASGRIVMAQELRASADVSVMTIGGSPVDFDGNAFPQRAGAVQQDLTFTFKTGPSPGRVRVFPESVWSIKSVRLKGIDVTGAPLEFIDGKDITGLEVEVTRRAPGRR
jgi:hypothetical protein